MRKSYSQPLARDAMAYVLAGGRGSRLKELTDNRAKPAVLGCGLPGRNALAISRAGAFSGACRSVAQPGRAPRSGRGGRRFKSCHSDQYLAHFPNGSATGYATASRILRCRVNARLAPDRWSG